MAKEFTVKAKYLADDQASGVIKKLRTEQNRLSKEVADSATAFAKGEISVDEYTAAVRKAKTEQGKLDTALKQTQGEIEKTGSRFSKLSTGVRANAIKITAVLTALAGAFRLVKSSADEAGQSQAFENGLAARGIAADEFIAKLREVSDNQIANADLILATNRAIALGIKADDLPALLDTAARASVNLGISVTQAFDDITTGVGRASPLILDNLGIVIDSTLVYDNYAASIGSSVEELTKQQRTIALTSAVIDQGSTSTDNFSLAQNDMTRAINRSQAAMANLASSTGSVIGGLTQTLVAAGPLWVGFFSLAAEGAIKLTTAILELAAKIPFLTDALKGNIEELKKADDVLDEFQQRMLKLTNDFGNGGIAAVKYGLGIAEVKKSASSASAAVDDFSLSTRKSNEDSETAAEILARLSGEYDNSTDSISRTTSALSAQEQQFASTRQGAIDLVGTLTQLSAAQRKINQFNIGTQTRTGTVGGRVRTADGTSFLIRSTPGGGGRFITLEQARQMDLV